MAEAAARFGDLQYGRCARKTPARYRLPPSRKKNVATTRMKSSLLIAPMRFRGLPAPRHRSHRRASRQSRRRTSAMGRCRSASLRRPSLRAVHGLVFGAMNKFYLTLRHRRHETRDRPKPVFGCGEPGRSCNRVGSVRVPQPANGRHRGCPGMVRFARTAGG